MAREVDLSTAPRISVEDAHRLRQLGLRVLFLDTRKQSEYQRTRLPGAVHMLVRDIPRRIAELPRHTAIVAYCA